MPQDNETISRRQWLGRVAAVATAGVITAATVSCRRDDGATTAAMAGDGVIPCDGCDRCMPCGYGVDIPAIFDFCNKAIAEGLMPAENDETEDNRRRERGFLHRYDREIDHRHAALRCIACWHCVSECPQKIIIPRELDRITRLIDRLRDKECYE